MQDKGFHPGASCSQGKVWCSHKEPHCSLSCISSANHSCSRAGNLLKTWNSAAQITWAMSDTWLKVPSWVMGLMCDSRARDCILTKNSAQPRPALPLSSPSALPSTGLRHLPHLTELCLSAPGTSQHHLAWSEHHIWYSDLKMINPALKREASQTVTSQIWSKMSLSCSTGVTLWDSSTEHKRERQLHQHQTQGFLTFSMSQPVLSFSHHALFPFFWKGISLSSVSCSSANLFCQQGSISFLGLLEITGKHNHYNQNWRHSLLLQQTSSAHITWYPHTSFCCPLSYLGQKFNQVEGAVMSCSQLEGILTYSLQHRGVIDWSPGSVAAL